MTRTLFKEEQKHSTPWIFLVIFSVIAMIIFFAKYNDWEDGSFDITEMDDILGLGILGVVMLSLMVKLTILFYKMKLITVIKSDGIHIKFPPKIKKERYISKTEISGYEIKHFDGKGSHRNRMMKKKLRQTSKSYTLSGKLGLIVYLANDKKVLIGTKRKEAIKYAMEKMMNNK